MSNAGCYIIGFLNCTGELIYNLESKDKSSEEQKEGDV